MMRKAFFKIRFKELLPLWEVYIEAMNKAFAEERPLTFEEEQVLSGAPIEALRDWERSRNE